MPFIEVNYPHEVLVVLFNEFNTGVIRLYGLPICHVFLTDVYKATFCASSPPPFSLYRKHRPMATRLRDSLDISPRSLNKFQGLYENNLTIPYNFNRMFSLCLPVLLCLL